MACRPAPVRLALLSLVALAAVACQRVPGDDEPMEESSGTDSGGEVVTDSGLDAEGGNNNNGPQFECEPGDETSCSMGQKCTAVSDGGPQNHFKCVPDDGKLLPGDDCTPASGTGQDGCTSGHVCLVSGLDDTQGRCLAACRNDDDCEPDACEISPFTLTTFCAAACDPLAPACDSGFGCRQSEDRFTCSMTLDETDIGQPGEPCDVFNLRGCADNLACMPGALVPGCASQSCCTTVCDLAAGDGQCPGGTLCNQMFATPAPGFESIGACFVPA